jgi:choloylglycine hydrolase
MCTNLVIPRNSQTQPVVSARSMDFANIIPTCVTVVPKGHSFPFFLEKWVYSKVHTWEAQYGFVGMSVGSWPIFMDGLNEKGLSVAALWLPQSDYACPGVPGEKPNVLNVDVVTWILSNFETAGQVKEALQNDVTVVGLFCDFFKKLLEIIPGLEHSLYIPVHFMVTDADRKSLVIEFVKRGEDQPIITFYDAAPGVMTNAPTYDWHLTNLSNYVNLKIENSDQVWWGQEINGSGMLGLPGDGTPPSRFIRAAKMLETQYSPPDEQSAVSLALQILNVCIVPRGTILPSKGGKKGDFTQWICARDHTHLNYFYQSFGDGILRGIRLKEIDFSSVQYKSIKIKDYENWYQNETERLKG